MKHAKLILKGLLTAEGINFAIFLFLAMTVHTLAFTIMFLFHLLMFAMIGLAYIDIDSFESELEWKKELRRIYRKHFSEHKERN